MDKTIKHADVSACLKYLIELGGMYKVDDNNFILLKNINNDNEITYKPETVKNNDVVSPLACYHDKDTPQGSIVVNPFKEGSVETIDKKWFYTSKTLIVSSLLISIIKRIIKDAIDSKNKKKKENIVDVSLEHIEFVSKFVDQVDDKLLEEFQTISENLKNFSSIYYLTNKREARFRVGIYDQSFRDPFKKIIRQKSWTVFSHIVDEVLQTTSEMKEFVCTPSDYMGAPKFEAFLKVLYVIFSKLDKFKYILNISDFKLDEFETHLKYFKEYQKIAKNWMVQPISTISKTKESDIQKTTSEPTNSWGSKQHSWSQNNVRSWDKIRTTNTFSTESIIEVPESIRSASMFTYSGTNENTSINRDVTVSIEPWRRNKIY